MRLDDIRSELASELHEQSSPDDGQRDAHDDDKIQDADRKQESDKNKSDRADEDLQSLQDGDEVDERNGENYDDGVILFYWITNNGSTFLVPWNSYSTITGALNISRSMNIRGISGDVWITIRRYDRDFEPRDTFGQFEGITYNRLRYVIIPGNVDLSGKSSLDYNDYEAVKAFYNLPD